MQRTHARLAFLLAIATAPLAGCSTTRPGTVDGEPAPRIGDDGVVVAQSQMVAGVTGASSIVGTQDDCAGPGLGITVEGTMADNKYLYDSNGEPCDPATTIFDGRTRVDSRAADPSIALSFHDSLGPQPEPRDELPHVDPSKLTPAKTRQQPDVPAADAKKVAGSEISSPEDAPSQLASPTDTTLPQKRVVAAPPPPKPDPLMSTISTWKAQDSAVATRSEETAEAAARNIDNIAKEERSTKEQELIAQLSSKLRERERQIQEEQRRQAETLARSEKNREQATAARQDWQAQQDKLQAELEATQQRLKQFEQLNQRLQSEKAEKEAAYQSKIKGLTSDLHAAEIQADASRRDLVLRAAAKIAEAERLAAAAAKQDQDSKLREASALKLEADRMMDEALAVKAGQELPMAPSEGPQLPLETVKVTIHAKNQTLEQLLDDVLRQAALQAGPWKADWQLSGKAQYILKEKWTLTAEAPVQQVLAQLAAQVQQAHGLPLSFTQFSQSRLLVVTDVPPEGKK